ARSRDQRGFASTWWHKCAIYFGGNAGRQNKLANLRLDVAGTECRDHAGQRIWLQGRRFFSHLSLQQPRQRRGSRPPFARDIIKPKTDIRYTLVSSGFRRGSGEWTVQSLR